MEMRTNRRIILFVSWSMVLLWMGVIFSLSAQVATESNALSHGVTEVVVETVEKVVPAAELDVDSLNHIIRKNAHFLAYLVLGILVSHAMVRSGADSREDIWRTLLICVLYAISDEMHQMIVPGRGPAVLDVMIDGVGICIGVMLFSLVYSIGKRMSA